MAATKEKLIEIIEEMHEKNILSMMRYGKKYNPCNGHIVIDVKSHNPETFSKIWKGFEKLGYIVESGGWNYLEIYYEEDTSDLDEIFNQYI